jgi:hypothetical protein
MSVLLEFTENTTTTKPVLFTFATQSTAVTLNPCHTAKE